MQRKGSDGSPSSAGGARKVGVSDVAALAGVSVGTVSNVLNGRKSVAPGYVERVLRAVEELGFVPNEAARTLRAGASRVIGFVISEEENPYFSDLVRGAELAAEESGGIVLVGHTRGEADREKFYLDAFAEQSPRGVIVKPSGDVTAELARLRAKGIPTVVLEPNRSTEGGSWISVDITEGGRLATDHLVSIGRRRLAVVAGPLDLPGIDRRVVGAREGAGSADLEVVAIPRTTIDHGYAAGLAIAARSAGDRPDGVFAGNDLVALGLLNAFTGAGVRVPDDIAIVGFDDISLARNASVPLSTIKQPSETIGSLAVRLIEDERLGDRAAQHVHLEPELVVRASAPR